MRRDLLIAAVVSPDPVVYVDDRWLYDQEDDLPRSRNSTLPLSVRRCWFLAPTSQWSAAVMQLSSRSKQGNCWLLRESVPSHRPTSPQPYAPECIVTSVERPATYSLLTEVGL